jgi:hypothetical protein
VITRLKRMLSRHPVSDAELSALVDGMLPPARRAAVTGHSEACDACRQKLAELRTLKAVLAAMPQTSPRRSFALSAEQAATRPAAPAATRVPRFAFAPAVAMSALVILLTVDFAVLDNGGSGGGDSVATMSGEANKGFADQAAPSVPAPARNAGGLAAESPATATASGAGAQRQEAAPPAGTPAPPTAAPAAAVRVPQRDAAEDQATPDEASQQDDGDDVPLIRLLEGVAVIAVVVSLAYAVMRSRKRPEFQ